MKIEIITIGDELLLGFTLDTNTAYLARQLAQIGVEVTRHSTVMDVKGEIVSEVNAALSRTGAVITSGGLGPTSDDISVESVAAAFGRELEEDAGVLARLEERSRARGIATPLSATSRRQAMIPVGAEVLLNRHGTAPGLWVEEKERGWVAMLPGVPREMRGLFEDEVRARIVRRVAQGRTIASRTLRTTGIAESTLAQRIVDSGLQIGPLAYLPGWEGVDLRVTERNVPGAAAGAILDAALAKLKSVAGEYAYGEDNTDLAAVVLSLAKERGLRIAVAESCTGGMLGARLTAIPGASEVFAGGVIAYADDVKSSKLGVPREVLQRDGAVSEAVVRAMAAGVCSGFGAQVGIAISGVAGPGGGSEAKPVGTVCVATRVNAETTSTARRLPGDRDEIRRRAAQMALDLARTVLRRLAP